MPRRLEMLFHQVPLFAEKFWGREQGLQLFDLLQTPPFEPCYR